MSVPSTLQELSKNPQYSPIFDAVIEYYRKSGEWSLICGLTEILQKIVVNEHPLISQSTGETISYTDLRALQVSDLLNSSVPSTDKAASWMMRDIVNEWIRKDFDRNCTPDLSTSIWCDRDTKLRKAVTELNISFDMLYHGLQEHGIGETLLSIPRKIIDLWAEGRSVYSLYVAEFNSGFLTLGNLRGQPTTDVSSRVTATSRSWTKPFSDTWNLLFQHDEADISDYFPSDSDTSLSASATTVALVRDETWLGYCEFLIVSPTSDSVPSNHLVESAFEGIENNDLRASCAASALTRKYGAPMMFQRGALVLLLGCEIVAEHRGHGIGFRLVEEALKELKRLSPDIRTIAWSAEPMQHLRGEWQENRPPSIQAEYNASKEKLLNYCLSKEAAITAVLSDAKGQAQSLIYRDEPGPDVFELFNVNEALVPLVRPMRH